MYPSWFCCPATARFCTALMILPPVADAVNETLTVGFTGPVGEEGVIVGLNFPVAEVELERVMVLVLSTGW